MNVGTVQWVSNQPLTYDDVQHFPADGHRYELVDGMLLVSPAPKLSHQRILVNLLLLLRPATPPDCDTLVAPVDWYVNPYTFFQPDPLVFRRADATEQRVESPPVLAVEILSRSTRYYDLGMKRLAYADAGLPWYWVLDPDASEGPSLLALRNSGGVFKEEARVSGDQPYEATEPFAVTVIPGALVD